MSVLFGYSHDIRKQICSIIGEAKSEVYVITRDVPGQQSTSLQPSDLGATTRNKTTVESREHITIAHWCGVAVFYELASRKFLVLHGPPDPRP